MSVKKRSRTSREAKREEGESAATSTNKIRKFIHPTKHSGHTEEPIEFISLPPIKPKTNAIADFEANLHQIWNVKKNISHSTNNDKLPSMKTTTTTTSTTTTTTTNNNKFPQNYSRHGAMMRQLNGADHHKPSHYYISSKIPLQEHNDHSDNGRKGWNIRGGVFSYGTANTGYGTTTDSSYNTMTDSLKRKYIEHSEDDRSPYNNLNGHKSFISKKFDEDF